LERVSRLPLRSHHFLERQAPTILPARGRFECHGDKERDWYCRAMVNSAIAFGMSSCWNTSHSVVHWSHYAAGQAASPWEGPELF
jgi:hypothetical protein